MNKSSQLSPGNQPVKYKLMLFIAAGESNSLKAKDNLVRLCEMYLNGHYELEVIDVFTDFQTALSNNILVTPTLLLVYPLPQVTIFGNLGDTEKVLVALRLNIR